MDINFVDFLASLVRKTPQFKTNDHQVKVQVSANWFLLTVQLIAISGAELIRRGSWHNEANRWLQKALHICIETAHCLMKRASRFNLPSGLMSADNSVNSWRFPTVEHFALNSACRFQSEGWNSITLLSGVDDQFFLNHSSGNSRFLQNPWPGKQIYLSVPADFMTTCLQL